MSTSNLANSIGLVCDIIGAVLIWRYGLPIPISRSGARYLVMQQKNETEIAKARRYDCITRWGIILLVSGFVLQLVSSFL